MASSLRKAHSNNLHKRQVVSSLQNIGFRWGQANHRKWEIWVYIHSNILDEQMAKYFTKQLDGKGGQVSLFYFNITDLHYFFLYIFDLTRGERPTMSITGADRASSWREYLQSFLSVVHSWEVNTGGSYSSRRVRDPKLHAGNKNNSPRGTASAHLGRRTKKYVFMVHIWYMDIHIYVGTTAPFEIKKFIISGDLT